LIEHALARALQHTHTHTTHTYTRTRTHTPGLPPFFSTRLPELGPWEQHRWSLRPPPQPRPTQPPGPGCRGLQAFDGACFVDKLCWWFALCVCTCGV